jgi:hypothetical protein
MIKSHPHPPCHLSVLSVAADPGGTHYLFEGRRTVFASDDVVFAWAFGKALLIVMVSFGTLVYAALAVTYQRKNATHVGIPMDSALKYKSSVKAGEVLLIANGPAEEAEGARRILARTSAEEINVHEPEQPAAAA